MNLHTVWHLNRHRTVPSTEPSHIIWCCFSPSKESLARHAICCVWRWLQIYIYIYIYIFVVSAPVICPFKHLGISTSNILPWFLLVLVDYWKKNLKNLIIQQFLDTIWIKTRIYYTLWHLNRHPRRLPSIQPSNNELFNGDFLERVGIHSLV